MPLSKERTILLEADIDIRMHEVMLLAAESFTGDDFDLVATYMRAAYGKGYTDALSEPVRGSLCIDNGYRVPRRQVGT